MNTQIIDKEKMESVKALADLTIKISDAKNILTTLQESETAYLVEREQTAITRIKKILEDSSDLISQAHKNYEDIQGLSNEVSGFCVFIGEIHDSFSESISEFREYQQEWDNYISEREKQVADFRKSVEIDSQLLENERKNIESGKKSLEVERIKLEDERETLRRAIQRLKKNKI